jgi:AhpD family alkylhydroperoxidase
MSRVEQVDTDQAPLAAKPFYANGKPGPIGETLAQVPELMEVALPFIGVSLGASSVADFRTKELVIVRASALQDCRYCTLTHMAIALDAGVSTEEMKVLRDAPAGAAAGAFADEREAALLAWTDAMALGSGDIPDDVFAEFSRHFSEPAIVDLTMTIGTTLMLNRYCTALELPVAPANLSKLAEAGLA